jgi:hypothetical protein
MMQHIDVRTVMRGTVCDLYSNLVTRPTGAAVRGAIEAILDERRAPSITTIDFSHVNLLDFSCADEIVAKLLLRHVETASLSDRYVCFRGMREDHLDAVEAVLEHRSLALVWDRDGFPELLGPVDDDARRHWDVVRASGPLGAPEVATALGLTLEHSTSALEQLWSRRLLMRDANGYLVPRGAPAGLT